MAPFAARVVLLAHLIAGQAVATAAAALADLVAAANNTVVSGNVRVTVHTPQLLRLEWSADATFDDRPTLAFVHRDVGAAFSYSTAGGRLVVNTSALSLSYTGGGAHFDGSTLAIAFTPRPGAPRSTWTPAGHDTLRCGTVAGQDRVDCGVPSPNATSCAAAGCCFDPNVNGTNYDQHLTHCYRPTVGGKGNLLGSVSTTDCDLDIEACIAWYGTQMNQVRWAWGRRVVSADAGAQVPVGTLATATP